MPIQQASVLRQRHKALAERIVDLQYERQPDTWKPYGHPGREKSVRDVGYHLTYLMEAIEAKDAALFNEYLAWAKILFAGLNFPESILPITLALTRQVLDEALPGAERKTALRFLDQAAAAMARAPMTQPSFIQGDAPIDALARQYLAALLRGERGAASQMVLDAVASGVRVQEVYLQVFQRTQHEIGRLWQTNQISVAQEHYCSAATQTIMSQLYPYIFQGMRKGRSVVVACVGGELHEIGARMVADLFEMQGWDSHFLGANTPPESILRTVAERRPDVLALSATITGHISLVGDLIRQLREKVPQPPRVFVGGYAFNLSPKLWHKVGADGFAPNAAAAVRAAERALRQ